MSLALPMIAQRAFNTPLLWHPGKAVAALGAIGSRIAGGAISFDQAPPPVDHVAFENGRPSMGRLTDPLGRAYDRQGRAPFDVIDGVAIIPIEGTLVHKGAWVEKNSGMTSYEGLQAQVKRAASIDAVKAVVFELDSFGGEMAGSFETAGMIRKLSAEKPTLAILTDFAYSAGYMMASQARAIVAPEFGGAGSIGVITMHVDMSGFLEQEGVKVTLLTSGEHKADFNQFEPLPAALADKVRAELGVARRRFAETVAAGRGSRLTAAEAMATEADAFRSPEALDLGLIDAVSEPSEALDAFISEIKQNR